MVLLRTTVATEEHAQGLAQVLIEFGLAACVHSWPIRSSYTWKGGIRHEAEVLVEARTTAEREVEVRRRMAKGHPYELPLIESVPIEVNREYARWAADAR
jgi:periplasmic divalent cation tolerance protein